MTNKLDIPAPPNGEAVAWQKGIALLREVEGFAKGNADAALTRDDQDTWRAHQRNIKRVLDLLVSPPLPLRALE